MIGDLPSILPARLAVSPHAAEARGGGEIGRTAEAFESLFISLLLEPLERAGASFYGAGPEGATFGGLFRREVADQIARARPLGIADRIDAVLRHRERAAEAANEKGRT